MKIKNPLSKLTIWLKRDPTRWFELFCYFWVAGCFWLLAYYRPDVVIAILLVVMTVASITVVYYKVMGYLVSRIDSSEGSETK
jgi:hypothetical protein